jgi:hypothetical protein
LKAAIALEYPVETILSGPAASVVGAGFLTGLEDFVVSDIAIGAPVGAYYPEAARIKRACAGRGAPERRILTSRRASPKRSLMSDPAPSILPRQWCVRPRPDDRSRVTPAYRIKAYRWIAISDNGMPPARPFSYTVFFPHPARPS